MTKYLAALSACALFAAAAAPLGAQEPPRASVSTSKLWIDGTSNLHEWSCKAEQLTADIDLDKAAVAQLSAASAKALKHVEVTVPVKSLKCGHGGMDDNVYKALKANDDPNVTYSLTSFDAAPGAGAGSFTLKTVGTLTIAGKQNSITMDVSAVRLDDGSIKATGVVPIKMTDYGIKPPTAIFGRLKTGDEVKVNFELTIGAKAVASSTGEAR